MNASRVHHTIFGSRLRVIPKTSRICLSRPCFPVSAAAPPLRRPSSGRALGAVSLR